MPVCHIQGDVALKISFNKKMLIPSCILSSLFIIALIIDIPDFFDQPFYADVLSYALCIFACLLIGALLWVDIKIENRKVEHIVNLSLFLLSPFLTTIMTEVLNCNNGYDLKLGGFFLNYLLILVFLALAFSCCGSYRISVIIVNPILFLFALANFYITKFRGSPFLPMDFSAIGTAMNVGGEYSFTITHQIVFSSLLLAFLIVLGTKLKTPQLSLIRKLITRLSIGLVCATLFLLFYFTDIFVALDAAPDFWKQARSYGKYGFVYNFFLNTKYLTVSEPSGYNSANIPASYEGSDDDDSSDNEHRPNIICIMNESFSDLSVLGDFETNIDYMPFINSLTENTVKGNLYVPVIGSGTSNTEYEFLTGNSISFLPAGSNAYVLYVKDGAASIVDTLNAQGYNSFAFHPYYESGWNRVEVYNAFGFSDFKSLEDIVDTSILERYEEANDAELFQELISEAYPENDDMLLRTYISDSYNYEVLIKDYENRDTSSPCFVFNVTMQNHGEYSKHTSNFIPDVCVTSTSKDYPLANQYLSLVKKSDDAFRELIEYFSNVDEPVVICMFGDHQPKIEDEFIEEIMGKPLSALNDEEEHSRYVTPFVIWANYDIKEKQIDRISSNYLSSLLLKTAGVELTGYNKYLLDLYEDIPVLDTVGYIDNEGNCYSYNDNTEYTELIKYYEYIQYNNVFDDEDKKVNWFYLNGRQ